MHLSLLLALFAVASPAKTHADLVALFSEWRAFQRPRLVDGVPDYGKAAMDAQRRALPAWQARLKELDTSGWPVSQQVDWHTSCGRR
jgi:predicted TIM-barrel fold metal-dependent hydrolase